MATTDDIDIAQVGIAELKAHLSEYVRAARAGAEIVIKDRMIEVARLVPSTSAASFRTSSAKGSLKQLDKLAGIQVSAEITAEYLDQLLRESRMDYYDKWTDSTQSTSIRR
jgi:prevent-host-death family protein